MAKSELLHHLQERGYFNQCTNLAAFEALSSNPGMVGYIGFDATAKSLHVGHLVQIHMLRALQKFGHKPIVLIGGGTTKLGDPSFKNETRGLLGYDVIEENKNSIAKCFDKFVSFGEGPSDAIMVDNSLWLDELKYIEFLRDIGKHFTINKMLSFDSVKIRLDREQPLTFLEFNYMLLQAYDFAEVNRRYGCRLQMGGSDQWGNIVNGIDLGRRLGSPELLGVTSKLITTKSGAKMGKSVSGAVWLNSDMLSAYDYWQFWRNTDDADVEKFLLMFTELPISEVKSLGALQGKELNDAKIILANLATALCHGSNVANHAHQTAIKTFEEGQSGDDLPIFEIEKVDLEQGIAAFKLFALCGLCKSGGEARRLIQGRGAKLNNTTIENEVFLITVNDMKDGQIKLSFGQKKHLIVKLK